MKETDLVRQCLDYLSMRGVLAWRNNTGAIRDRTGRPVKFGTPGSPDILGVLPGGRTIGIECKVGRNKPTELQAGFLAELTRMGAVAGVVRTLDDLDRLIEEGEARTCGSRSI